MQDGRTRKLTRPQNAGNGGGFIDRYLVTLVLTKGPAAGSEFLIRKDQTMIGRGPGVDLEFDDSSMSREHAAVEWTDDSFRIRDLGSTNGMLVNGSQTLVGDLKHGDSICLGEHSFQFLIERLAEKAGTYVLPGD
jgi:pSer/pThr/pTyr-binding forkhead associated (FHA) protein